MRETDNKGRFIKNGVIKYCKCCGKSFYLPLSRKDRIFCSRACMGSDKTFREDISKRIKGKYVREKSPRWKGGLISDNQRDRKNTQNILWRIACFERDNFTCQKTGNKGGDLEVHHINNFADFPEFRFDVENGITLSKKAHKEFHCIYGFRNNTREQLLQFLNKQYDKRRNFKQERTS